MMRSAVAALHLLAALLIGSRDVSADALYLNWNDCASSTSAASTASTSCPMTGSRVLVLSFELSQALDNVIGLEADVDVQVAADSLPDWWQLAPGGCSYGRLVGSANFGTFSACSDFWAGQATFDGPPVYTVRPNHDNVARITVSFAVPSNSPRTLLASTRYYAARLELAGDAGPCVGCQTSACLVLNSVRLLRTPEGGPVPPIEAAGPGDANRVSWQSAGADCSVVPARRWTWGRLKTLYR